MTWVHLCIDMQRMFAEPTPWQVPWVAKISGQVVELAGRFAERTVFTRFLTPQHGSQMPGRWHEYYAKWECMTRENLPDELLNLVPELGCFVPPARVFTKTTYSPWVSGHLHQILTHEHVDTVVITGGETDVCVLAAVLGAVDLGYHVIIPADAVCSGADNTHDSTLDLLGSRFSVQVEVSSTEQILSSMR